MEGFFIRPYGRTMKNKRKLEKNTILRFGKRSFRLLINGLILACWSAIIATMMLPYQIFRVFVPARKPGRPGSHPISKVFTKAFEGKRVKRFIGSSLTMIMILFGTIENTMVIKAQTFDTSLITVPQIEVITEKTLERPIDGMLAQGFHGWHRGIDLLAPIGTEIKPITKGKVVEVSFGKIGWGNTIVVEHDKGLKSRYAHLKNFKVSVGDEVGKESTLGTVGMTGWTTGPHLHLEIYQDNKAIDPKTVLPEALL